MALSTRNRIPAEATEVVKGEATALVSIRAEETTLVALITRKSAEELGLEAGQQVTAASLRAGIGRSVGVFLRTPALLLSCTPADARSH